MLRAEWSVLGSVVKRGTRTLPGCPPPYQVRPQPWPLGHIRAQPTPPYQNLSDLHLDLPVGRLDLGIQFTQLLG